MAFVHGKDARIYFNSTDLSPYLHTAGLDIQVANSDTTTFVNSGWMSNMAGTASATATFDGYDDVALDAVLAAKLQVESGVLTYAPGGISGVGSLVRMMPVTATGLSGTTNASEVAAFSWAAAAQDSIAFGWALHPLAEDTNTTTGTSRDDAAATTSGWTAHLHVPTAPDGGSWAIKLEDSANNSAWSDVTGGAFTAVTGATSQRLRSAVGATLRRYVRYTATRTGGSAGDGITFLLCYSRDRA